MLSKRSASVSGLLAGVMLFLTACGPDTDEARHFDNTIQRQQEAVVGEMFNLAESAAAGNYDSLPEKREQLLAVSSAALDTIRNLTGPEGSAPYQEAAAALFSFYRETAGDRFAEMIELVQKGDYISENEQQRLDDLNIMISKDEAALDDAYLQARERFLTQYGLASADIEQAE